MENENIIKRLETRLEEMQKELEQLKNPKPEDKNNDLFETHREALAEAQKSVMDVLKKMIEDGAKAAGTVISVTAFDGTGNGTGTSVFHSLDDLAEDGLAAALDVFTNPRRISILKLLIPEAMTPSEISRNTGLVGGQLYHHLSILENAGLLFKTADKYRTKGETQILLCGLHAAVGGMDIAKR